MLQFTTVALISLREAKYLTQTSKTSLSVSLSLEVNDVLEHLGMMNQISPSVVQ